MRCRGLMIYFQFVRKFKNWIVWNHENQLVLEMTKFPLKQSTRSLQLPKQLLSLVCVIHNYGNTVNSKRKDVKTFWAQKTFQGKLTKQPKILNCIKSSCIVFCAKMFEYSHFACCFQKELTHFGLRVLANFRLEVSKHFELQKSHQKN